MASSLLEVRGLSTRVQAGQGEFSAVDSVSFDVGRGESVAVVGESGCGKTLLALSIVGLLPNAARVASGEVRFDGVDLLALTEAQKRAVRGSRLGMVFQDSLLNLNPVLTVGEQISEVLRADVGMGRVAARREAVEALRRVGIPDPEERAAGYPHQLSGGMRQRVCIAMAVAGNPALLIADEPTSALDPTVAAQNLAFLRGLSEQRSQSMLLISHDLRAVGRVADRVVVMYAGQIVELATAKQLFESPAHPYTEGLLRCALPKFDDGKLCGIPGSPPARGGGELPGCRFGPRCHRAKAQCGSEAPKLHSDRERWVRCWFPSRATERPAKEAG